MSTWFANARRRLKKENKMTWEPKNKLDDEDVDVSDDDDKDKDDDKHGKHEKDSFPEPPFIWKSISYVRPPERGSKIWQPY